MKTIIFSGALIALAPNLVSADPLVAFEEAIGAHPAVAEASANLRAAEFRQSSVFSANWRPRLDLSLSVGRQRYESASLSPGQSAPTLNTARYSAVLTQPIYDFGKSDASGREQDGLVAEREALLGDVIESVKLDALLSLVSVHQANAAEVYAKRSVESVSQQTAIETTMVDLGTGYESSVLQAKVQLSAAAARLRRAEGAVQVAAAQQETAFGGPVPAPLADVVLRPKSIALPESLSEALSAAESTSLKLAALSSQGLATRARAESLQLAATRPRIELVGELSQRENVDAIAASGRLNDRKVSLQATYSFNLAGGDIAQADAVFEEVKGNASQLASVLAGVRQSTTIAWRNLETARFNEDTLSNQVRIAAKFFEAVSAERAIGRRTPLDLSNAEVSLINAMADLVNVKAEVISAELSLLSLAGELSPANLQVFDAADVLPLVIQ